MRLVYVSNHFGTIKECLWRNNHHFPSLVRQAISPASYSDKTPKALVTLVESVDSSFYGDPSHPSMWANIKQLATHLYSWGRTHRKPKAQCWQAICIQPRSAHPKSLVHGPGPIGAHSTSFLRTWPTIPNTIRHPRPPKHLFVEDLDELTEAIPFHGPRRDMMIQEAKAKHLEMLSGGFYISSCTADG